MLRSLFVLENIWSLLKVNKNVKVIFGDNLSLIKSAFEIGSSAD